MYGSKITSKGQITVPKVIREALAVYAGDRIRFVLNEDSTVTVEAETVDLASLKGALKPAGRQHVSIEAMGDAVHQAAVDGFRGTTRHK